MASLRIASRGSPLALIQAEQVKAMLARAWPELAAPGAIEIVVIRTTGDRVTDRSLSEIGGKGLFTKEIEEALFANTADLAVHSMKDVETRLPDGLVIDCLPPREDAREVLVAAAGSPGLADLPHGAVVGTSSLRRRALVRAARPDLRLIEFRGNVDTRLAKLARGEAAATLLALAGLKRLGRVLTTARILSVEEFLPAVAQGALGIERRGDDERVARLLAPLNDATTARAVAAERAVLAALDGSCRTPIAAHARIDGGRLELDALVARPDGSQVLRTRREGAVADAARLGTDAGAELKARAGAGFFQAA